MVKVGIVTDTTNCLPPELIQEYDIRVTPMSYIMEGKTYRDGVDITTEEFYKISKNLTQPTYSNGVTTGDFVDTFRNLGKTTSAILAVTISNGLSVTYKAALSAKEIIQRESPGLDIEVLDSKTTLGAQGFITLEAARAAREGKPLKEVLETAQNMMPRVRWMFMVESLKYLIKCGRAPKVGGWMGEMLNFKPIMGISGPGETIQPIGKVRGKEKAVTHMIGIVKKEVGGKPVHLIVHFAEMREEGERLKEMITAEIKCTEVYISEFTPIMMLKTGPILGLSFYF